jgi:hypothetical protein
MWNIRRRIAVERLPARRVVVRFDYKGIPSGHRSPGTYWLELNPPEVDLCVSDPGFEVDLYVEADLAAMSKVWLGDLSLASVLRSGEVRITGPRTLVRAFQSWLPLSAYAAVPRPAPAAARGESGVSPGPHQFSIERQNELKLG